MKVNAVFTVYGKKDNGYGGVDVQMSPPYALPLKPGEQKPEGDSAGAGWKRVNDWATATPSGSITMTITNPAAAAAFEPQKTYLVTFEPYEE
jgi:hypothetical protein